MKKDLTKSIKKAAGSSTLKKILTAGAVIAAAAAAAAAVTAVKKRRALLEGKPQKNLSRAKNVYISGTSLASFAAAAYLIKDGGYPGKAIHIYGTPSSANTEEYGSIGICTRALLRDIEARTDDDFSIDTMFDNISYAAAPEVKVIDADSDVRPLTLKPSKSVLKALSKALKKLSSSSARELNELSVAECFGETSGFADCDLFAFIEMTFGIRSEHKVSEFLARVEQLLTYAPKAGLFDTLYYDFSILSVIENYLEENGADIHPAAEITDVGIADNRVNAIHLVEDGTRMTIYLNREDFVILDTGNLLDGTTEGSFNSAAPKPETAPQSMDLWKSAAEKDDSFGLPEMLLDDTPESVEFSIVDDNGYLLRKICNKLNEEPDNGISVLFEASNWRMKLTSEPYSFIPAAPQDESAIDFTVDEALNTTSDADEADITPEDIEAASILNAEPEPQPVICVKGVYAGSEGNFINKTMRECTGVELLYELCCHLGMLSDWEEAIDRIKVVMISCSPYKASPLRKAPAYAVPEIRPCDNCMLTGGFILTDAPAGTIEQQIQCAKKAAYTILGKKEKRVRPKLVDVRRL
ncbi:MAG: oleate hydratase [bacterium]|nr:oleate hydratase [bacterium]